LYQPIVVVLLIAATNTAGYPSAGADNDFAGLVDIGSGRSLYLDCQGAGSPVVFIIPGKGGYAEVASAPLISVKKYGRFEYGGLPVECAKLSACAGSEGRRRGS
jgi:hypothetical protein